MKKYSGSLIFDLLLATVLLWGLVSPQSPAITIVVARAIFSCLVCVFASLIGVVAYYHWVRNRRKGTPVNPRFMKLLCVVFCRKTSPARRVGLLIFFAVTVICLLNAGWIFTALIYLICVLTFMGVCTSYRQRIEGAGLCPDSL